MMSKINLLQSRPWTRVCAVTSVSIAAFCMPSTGGVLDRPAFDMDGMVIVWGADSTQGTPIASDFILEDGGANTDLIADDVFTVVTGTLDALDETYANGTGATLVIQRIQGGPNQNTRANGDRVTSVDDTFTAFQLRNNTDVRTVRSEIESSFYVASNKAFSIDATSSAVGDPADLDLVRLRMRVDETGTDGGLSYGASAQLPHTNNAADGGVRFNGYRRLSRMTSGENLFNGNRKTARLPGSIADQSVRFHLTYRWNTGNIDLSEGTFDVEAEVIYTVYIP